MQIVIDIPDKVYGLLKYFEKAMGLTDKEDGDVKTKLIRAVVNGTPLPKGHGRLIDVSDIEWAKHFEERNYIDYEVIDWDDIVNAPTIIKAESEE